MFAARVLAFVAAAVVGVSALPADVKPRSVTTGKATFYNSGMSQGNCGWWSTENDHVVALNTKMYGSTKVKSDHCGKLIRIVNKANNKVMHAVVADSCPTCEEGALDLSTGLFRILSDGKMDLGVLPIEWSFISP